MTTTRKRSGGKKVKAITGWVLFDSLGNVHRNAGNNIMVFATKTQAKFFRRKLSAEEFDVILVCARISILPVRRKGVK